MEILNQYSFDQMLDATLASQAIFVFSYFISALVVSGDAFAGFNSILLGITYCGMIYFSFKKLKKNLISRTTYGILLGAAFMLVLLSLQSAILWGQYSGCTSTHSSSSNDETTSMPSYAPTLAPNSIRRLSEEALTDMMIPYSGNYGRQLYISVQCKNKPAMRSVCAFSVFLFLSYIMQVVIMIRFKDDILQATPNGDGIDKSGYSAVPASIPPPLAASSIAPTSRLPSSVDV